MDEDKKWFFSGKIHTMEAFAEFFQAVFAASHPEMAVETVRSQGVTGLALIKGGEILVPMVRLDTLYDRYVDGCSLRKIFYEILSACEEYDSRGASLLEFVEDYGLVSHRICFGLVNYEKNKELLEKMPHTHWLDLALVLYIPVSVNGGKALYLPVDNDLVGKWGIQDTGSLFEGAFASTPKIFPGSIRDMEDVFSEDYGNAPETGFEDDEERMYIATNNEKFYGAAVILYDGLLASFAQGLDSDLYILPTSINEMTVIADTGNLDTGELREVLRNLNLETTEDRHFLSNNIYHYDRGTGNFSIV